MALVLSDFHSAADSTGSSSSTSSEVYVAVGNGSSDTRMTLLWAIQRFPDHKFCILHVRQTPSSDAVLTSDLSQEERDIEAAILSSELDEYLLICNQYGAVAEQVYIEADSIENGILELIFQRKIQKLVMGAAADLSYDVNMHEVKSSKGIYVNSHAPAFCHIWFICDGNLVCTREAKIDSSSSLNTQETIRTYQSDTNMEAVCRANALDKLYTEEIQKRKEVEAEVEILRKRNCKLTAEVAPQILLNKKYEQTIRNLEEKVNTYAEMVKLLKEERDEAVKLTRELTDSVINPSSETNSPVNFLTLPFSEILNAASESNQSSRLLCEGELGNIYKATLYQTDMTLRFFPAEDLLAFQHEVKILSKFRHPNLASLVGACPDTMTIVYELLPNGSLEDRLRCKANTEPLSWQTRIRIAVDLCSALIFLHSHGVIHGALRPSCVLLDPNLTCKIVDFRISETSISTSEIYVSHYTDPDFLDTKKVSPLLDVYSFGLLLLELLTGKPGFSVEEEVKCSLDEGKLDSLLDTSAGDWLFLQAEQLAHLGLRCCDAESLRRPDLITDVWKVLEPMRLSIGSALSFNAGETPSYFVCPIIQEAMTDPHVAADGYTYEAEAIKQWLDRGNETSPMTNLQLEDTRLVPNRALRSAIQEWLQLHQQ